MNTNFIEFSFNIYILIAIFISFNNLSIILCKKSVPLKNSPKNSPKSQPKNSPKSSPAQTEDNLVKISDTTISRKLPAHGEARSGGTGEGWHYGENWPQKGYDICGGQQQSPIRLSTSNAVADRSMHMTFNNYNRLVRSAFIENNGHTVQIGFSDRFKASLYGTATNYRRYIFKQMHFHWGSYDGVGSEHTVDGYRGPMELHLVHYNAKYGKFDDAVDKSDGLMVLGILYKTSSRNNSFLTSVMKLVKKVPKYEDKADILVPFTLKQLLPTRKRPFFMYSGSLTTPPCYESVQWLVFKRPVLIGDAQERQFRRCRGEYVNQKTGRKRTLSNNYRPVQAINERQIIIST